MLSVSRDVFIGGAVARVHPVKSMRITSFSDAWSTYEPSGDPRARAIPPRRALQRVHEKPNVPRVFARVLSSGAHHQHVAPLLIPPGDVLLPGGALRGDVLPRDGIGPRGAAPPQRRDEHLQRALKVPTPRAEVPAQGGVAAETSEGGGGEELGVRLGGALEQPAELAEFLELAGGETGVVRRRAARRGEGRRGHQRALGGVFRGVAAGFGGGRWHVALSAARGRGEGEERGQRAVRGEEGGVAGRGRRIGSLENKRSAGGRIACRARIVVVRTHILSG